MSLKSTSRMTTWLFILLDTLLTIICRLPIMSVFITRLAQRLDDRAAAQAPLNTDGAKPEIGTYERGFVEALELIKKPAIPLSEVPTALNALKSNINGEGLDDRTLLLEKAIESMSRAKNLSLSMRVQQFFITLLYKDLPHPPSSYVGVPRPPTLPAVDAATFRRRYAFREPDGSNYNPLCPTMGMAGSPYARSVPSTNSSPGVALPDAGLVFDTLLKRDKFVKHPGGISSLFFAFADLVIHSIFNTDYSNPQINKSSSYLDLSILYGNNQQEVDAIRRKDGSGMLFDDTFADMRLLLMPPSACALLVLLSRNHNFIAQRLLDINEFGNFKKTFDYTPEGAEAKLAQDEEIFNRTRLVNCGYFMKIILGDYVGAILGLVRDQSDWRLDPLMPIREFDHSFTPVGEGNVVSVEFNLLYRWHATLCEEDTQWLRNDVFKKAFPDKNPAELEPSEFVHVAHAVVAAQARNPPSTWTFDSLKRTGPNGTGRFADADLARILQNATDYHAGAFGARGIPETLRVVELMAIEQSRKWGTCSLNEFRKFLGLKPYKTFQEWNPDEKVYTTAAALYKDIDNLELHVGLQAEECKKPGPGAGLCPGYTISRAILADAVCLTRGDRFMTAEFTPHNLTAWGYQDCQYDTQDGSFGGMLTKLLFRTLPDYYPKGSAYAHFPFMQPQSMQDELMKREDGPQQIGKYDWTRPKPRQETVSVFSYPAVKRVLEDTKAYRSSIENQLFNAVKPTLLKQKSLFGSFSKSPAKLNGDLGASATVEAQNKFNAHTAELSQAVFGNSSQEVAFYFKRKVLSLVAEKAIAHIGSNNCYVDIVKDVIKLLPIHWISEEVANFPLKTNSNPHGLWYESITCDKFADIADYIYLDFDPVNDWRLRQSSQHHAHGCIKFIKNNVDSTLGGIKGPLLKKLWEDYGSKKGCTPREFASYLFAAIVPTAALYSQALANVVDFYLEEDKRDIRENIVKLAQSDKNKSPEIMAYVYEALRLRPIIAGVYRTALQNDPEVSPDIQTGKYVFASIVDANSDESVFGPNALSPNFTRVPSRSVLLGFDHGFLNPTFFETTVPAALGAIFSLQNLQRGPGNSGKLLTFSEDYHGVKRVMYPSQRGLVDTWAESLVLQFTA